MTEKLFEININEFKKNTQKLSANILGYQVQFSFIKNVFDTINTYTKKLNGIDRNHLYDLIFNPTNEDPKKKKENSMYRNSITFLRQTGFITQYENPKQKILASNSFKYPNFSFELNFFNAISKLEGVSATPYIVYNKLLKKNIVFIEENELGEFANSLGGEYNINNQQLPWWGDLMSSLNAIEIISSKSKKGVRKKKYCLIPNTQNVLEILKSILKNDDFIILLDVINYFEDNFYPVLSENKKDLCLWFKECIKFLIETKKIEEKDYSDSKRFDLGGGNFISHIKIRGD